MLTFFDFISTIHGCSSMRHGVARRGHSFSRLSEVSKLIFAKAKMYLPAFDEILEILRPLDASLWLILERGNWLSNDVSQ